MQDEARSGTSRAFLGAAAFYTATAIPMSYVFYLLPAQLREAGHSAATISLLALVYLPYALRALWAPAIDRYARGDARRFKIVLAACAAMAVPAVLAFGLVEPAGQIASIMTIAAVLFVILSTGTTGLDGYTVATLGEGDRRHASIWQTVGFTVGGVVLGLGAMLAGGLAWSAVVVLIALATAVAALPILALPADRPSRAVSIHGTGPGEGGSTGAFLRNPAVWRLLCISLLSKMGLGMIAGYLPILQVDYGVSASQAGFFGAFGSNVLGLGSALVGGWFLLRIGGLRAIGAMGLVAAVFFALAALTHETLRSPAFAITLTLIFLSLGYAFIAPFKALSLAVSDGPRCASRAAVLASVDLSLSILAASISGSLVTALGLESFLWLSMVLCLAAAGVALRTAQGRPDGLSDSTTERLPLP